MRVISSFVLAGWLLGVVAAPCLIRVPCAATARPDCCCGNGVQCCCHLKADRSPVSPVATATAASITELLGSPGVHCVAHVAPEVASGREGLAVPDFAPDSSPLSYLSSQAFRC
jgi:hypothetical protein